MDTMMPEADIVIESPGGRLLPPRDFARASAILTEWRAAPIEVGGKSHGPGVVRWAIVGPVNQIRAEHAIEQALLASGSPCGLAYPHTILYHPTLAAPEATVGSYSDHQTVGTPPTNTDDLRSRIQLALRELLQLVGQPGGPQAVSEALDYAKQHAPDGSATRLLTLLALQTHPSEADSASGTQHPTVVHWLVEVLKGAAEAPAARQEQVMRTQLREGPKLPGNLRQYALGGNEWGSAIVAASSDRRFQPAELRRLAVLGQEIMHDLRTGPTERRSADRSARDGGALPYDDEPDGPI